MNNTFACLSFIYVSSYGHQFVFVEFNEEYVGWCRSRGLKPIVVDPGLYLSEEDEMYYATQRRKLPDAYWLFTGECFKYSSLSHNCLMGP